MRHEVEGVRAEIWNLSSCGIVYPGAPAIPPILPRSLLPALPTIDDDALPV
ncbi:MAG TPA: hypothetical protein VFB38_12095 [Chthonomonadaceae bacterium]|nr:hypothetical protein [Chthonomonadaceae bacterium]